MTDDESLPGELKIIKNPSVEAYRRYLEDPTVDYHLEVKKEVEEANRNLRKLAREIALQRLNQSSKYRSVQNRKAYRREY